MTYNKAELHLIEYLKTHKVKVEGNEVKDFCLHGDESLEEVEGYANDYLSDIASDEAEYKSGETGKSIRY